MSDAETVSETQGAANDEEARMLCVSGRDVVRRTRTDCRRLQEAERAAAGPVSRVLDLATIEYTPAELTLDLLEGIVIGARYNARVQPSYRDGLFTRIDTYRFASEARPGDFLGRTPLKVRFNRGSELLFAQQFASGQQARSPLSTYLPD
ncbi:MAG: hypothetical protein AAGA95_18135, partial [Pseudomonadota bacterium]